MWHTLLGLTLLAAAGCQTYPPPYTNGYQGSFPAGTYAPPSGGTYVPQGAITVPATPAAPSTQQGVPPTTQWKSPASAAPATAPTGAAPKSLPKSVPNYSDAGTISP